MKDVVSVKELFISFLEIKDTTDAGFTETISKTLCDDYRWHDYGTGTNMQEKQRREKITNLNQLTFFRTTWMP